jgi:hypothetical protein
MRRQMSRKAFFATLGTAGVGIGLAAGSLGVAPRVFAQDEDGDDDTPALEAWADADGEELRLRFYQEFTTALADELGVSNAGDVDPAIRAAWSAVIDGLQADDLVTAGQATALKALIADAEVPVGPGPLFGPRPGMIAMRIRGPEGAPGLPAADAEPAPPFEQALPFEQEMQDRLAMRERLYPDFTAALADGLGAGSADEVDGAIRLAMIAAIDALAADDSIPAAPAEHLKVMVAMADAPLGPGLAFGPPFGMVGRGRHGGDRGPRFGGRGEDGRERFGPRAGDDDAAEPPDDDATAEEDDSAA